MPMRSEEKTIVKGNKWVKLTPGAAVAAKIKPPRYAAPL